MDTKTFMMNISLPANLKQIKPPLWLKSENYLTGSDISYLGELPVVRITNYASN